MSPRVETKEVRWPITCKKCGTHTEVYVSTRLCVECTAQERKALDEPTVKVADTTKLPAPEFKGTINGKGIKGSMLSPKSPVDLIPPQFILGISAVLLAGAKKYNKHNWMNGMRWTEVMGGVFRHLLAFLMGEELDKETGLPHLYHAACGIMFLAYYAHGPRNQEYRTAKDEDGNPLDDRVFKENP